jgi:gluconate kinase
MQIVVVFGFPGAGKSFVAEVLKKDFGFYHHDADVDMPADLLKAVNTKALVTEQIRDRFFQKIIEHTKHLITEHQKLVVSQTFIKEKYREQFLRAFPEVKFMLVKTTDKIRENRLMQRKNFPIDLEYARKMCLNFDQPNIPHSVVDNDEDNDENIRKQLQLLPLI